MNVYNKYIWIGMTDVHEPFLQTADSHGCSAPGEQAVGQKPSSISLAVTTGYKTIKFYFHSLVG